MLSVLIILLFWLPATTHDQFIDWLPESFVWKHFLFCFWFTHFKQFQFNAKNMAPHLFNEDQTKLHTVVALGSYSIFHNKM